jgi:type IX secretion system PorP/SprF family membrane protein
MKFKMKKILVTILLALCFSSKIFAQQDPQYTQYMFNMLAINPAYAGNQEDVLSATALFRRQWVGIEGAPTTQTFSMHAPVMQQRLSNIGLGGLIMNDKIGISNALTATISGAYRIKFGRGNLAMGINGGIRQYRADFTSVQTSLSGQYDPAFAQNITEIMPVVGVGFFYNTDRFYAGISTPQLLSMRQTVGNANIQHFSHFFGNVGYVFDLNETFKLKPSAMLKFVQGSPLSVDLNSNLWWKERIGLGLSWRVGDSVDALLEIRINNNFSFGYAYDYTLTELRNYNTGSHELMLRYQCGVGKKRGKDKIITPRQF